MGRIEKTVFISYRRTNKPWALFIYQNLTNHGYDVFIDFQNINSGNFETAILDNIRARAHFVVVLTPSALENCKNPGDWLRREIETAIDERRNIVPLMVEGFDFGSPLVKNALTGKLAALSDINGLRIPDDYPFEAMDRLRERYLNVAIEDVVLSTLKQETQEVAIAEKSAANEAAPVKEEELTAQTWFERGYVFQQERNFNEAFRCYTESIRLQPNIAAAHNNLGIILNELKRYDEAEAAYRKAIELNPSDDIAYVNLGLLLHKGLKRYDEAEIAYRKAVELNPSSDKAYSGFGLLLHEGLKRYSEAEGTYRKAIELNPSDDIAYNNLGNMLKSLKRYEEAEVAYRKSIELDPSDTTVYSNLAIFLQNMRRYVEAEAAYRKAIELNPSEPNTYYTLGNFLQKLKRYGEAEAAYSKAIELDPSFSAAYNGLVMLLRLKNRIEEAMPLLKKIIGINPKDFNPYLAIASINKKTGESVSKDYIEKARQLMPEDDWHNRACLESVCDNFDLALEHLSRAVEQDDLAPAWAWDDPDLQWIRDDPRFIEIAGPKPE